MYCEIINSVTKLHLVGYCYWVNQWLYEQRYELSWRWACGPETCRDPAIYESNSDISWFSFHIFWLLFVIAKFQLQAASKDCTTDASLQVTKQTSAAVNPSVPLKSNLGHDSSETDQSVWRLYYLLAHSRTVSWSAYNHLLPNLFQFIKHQSFYPQYYTVWPIYVV